MTADYALIADFQGAVYAARAAREARNTPVSVRTALAQPLNSRPAMTPDELKHRTRTFAIEVIKLARSLPQDFVTQHVARQLMRSGTSVGANYRSACRARSEADFIAKMSIVEEEADEAGYWLEVLVDINAVPARSVTALASEADQLTRIVVASIRTARGRSR